VPSQIGASRPDEGTDTAGRALIDIDGSGRPADETALAALSITTDEPRQLDASRPDEE